MLLCVLQGLLNEKLFRVAVKERLSKLNGSSMLSKYFLCSDEKNTAGQSNSWDSSFKEVVELQPNNKKINKKNNKFLMNFVLVYQKI